MRIAATFASFFFAFMALSTQSSAEVLVLGSVNDNVQKHVERMTPMARYLEGQLADYGITEVEILVATSSDQMISELSAGSVDLYFDSPLVAAHVARSSGAEPFLRRWKRGEASYHSMIIASAESDIQTLEDLEGHRIGFQEPDSTSGFLLPVDMLLEADITLRELSDRSEQVEEGEVGYVFTEDDKNTLLWLARGWISAGATDPRRWAQLNEARPGEFRVIANSFEVPRQVVVRCADMPPELAERISEVLQAVADTEGTAEILQEFHKTTRFDTFPRGVEPTFAPIHQLLDRLKAAGLL